MLTAELPPKRSWVPFWKIGAFCADCGAPMTCRSTQKVGSIKVQQRKCTVCGKCVPNAIPSNDSTAK